MRIPATEEDKETQIQSGNFTSAKKQHRSSRATREAIEGYLYISPWIIGFLVLTLGPMLASLFFSLSRYNILRPAHLVGFDNYIRAFSGQDRLFYSSLSRTLTFVLYYVPFGMLISLGLAMLLDRNLKGTTVYRTLFFMPTLAPAAAVTLLWKWLMNPEIGLINYLLRSIGVTSPPRWLGSPTWALPSIVMIAIWSSVGGARMIIFLAALQGVPRELYESAEIDGANAWHRFRHVTLPMISPVFLLNLVLAFIGAFQVFTLAYMGTGGGPSYATYFYMLHLYKTGFQSLNMGYASMLAWVLFAIIFILTILQFRLSRSWVFYSGEVQEA